MTTTREDMKTKIHKINLTWVFLDTKSLSKHTVGYLSLRHKHLRHVTIFYAFFSHVSNDVFLYTLIVLTLLTILLRQTCLKESINYKNVHYTENIHVLAFTFLYNE